MAARQHKVHLGKLGDGLWHWRRTANNGTTIARSHRGWRERGDAKQNLLAVNAVPFILSSDLEIVRVTE